MNEPMVYPTVWAYEKACAALHESKAEVERLRVNAVAREGVLKREGDLLRGAQAVRDKLLARLQGEDFDISDMHDDNARLQVEVATLINRLKDAYAAAGISWSTNRSLAGVVTALVDRTELAEAEATKQGRRVIKLNRALKVTRLCEHHWLERERLDGVLYDLCSRKHCEGIRQIHE